jgi:spore cortex formation protein SpoVR/YcgB (stage V sporulation)
MPSHDLSPFPDELLAAKKQIREQARSYGLDFFPVILEMCDYEQMNQIAAYGGFPQRYPHWRFGMEYESLRKRHATPAKPRCNVLMYLLQHARREDWQADCLAIVREESYYFPPKKA